jgi:hypothetical protein
LDDASDSVAEVWLVWLVALPIDSEPLLSSPAGQPASMRPSTAITPTGEAAISPRRVPQCGHVGSAARIGRLQEEHVTKAEAMERCCHQS